MLDYFVRWAQAENAHITSPPGCLLGSTRGLAGELHYYLNNSFLSAYIKVSTSNSLLHLRRANKRERGTSGSTHCANHPLVDPLGSCIRFRDYSHNPRRIVALSIHIYPSTDLTAVQPHTAPFNPQAKFTCHGIYPHSIDFRPSNSRRVFPVCLSSICISSHSSCRHNIRILRRQRVLAIL